MQIKPVKVTIGRIKVGDLISLSGASGTFARIRDIVRSANVFNDKERVLVLSDGRSLNISRFTKLFKISASH